jgi:hypothetical protein
MTCNNGNMRELLPDYAIKSLVLEEMERVRDHLMGCAECRDELTIIELFADDRVPEPPPGFWSSLPGRITRAVAKKRRRIFHMPIPVRIAGLAVTALLIAVVIGPWKGQITETEIPGEYYTLIPDRFNLGLEEEILFVSGLQVTEVDLSLEQQISLSDDLDYLDIFESAFQSDLYEGMDEGTIRIFERLIEDLAPQGVERG